MTITFHLLNVNHHHKDYSFQRFNLSHRWLVVSIKNKTQARFAHPPKKLVKLLVAGAKKEELAQREGRNPQIHSLFHRLS